MSTFSTSFKSICFTSLIKTLNNFIYHWFLLFSDVLKIEVSLIYVLPLWLSGKECACNAGVAGDIGSIPWSRRSPGGGNGNPLQYSCLRNPMDRGAWKAIIHGVTKGQTQLKRLSKSTVDLQFCVNSLCAAKWLNYI